MPAKDSEQIVRFGACELDRASARIRRAGKAAGILTSQCEAAADYLESGFTFVAVGSDVGVLAQGTASLAERFRAQIASFSV